MPKYFVVSVEGSTAYTTDRPLDPRGVLLVADDDTHLIAIDGLPPDPDVRSRQVAEAIDAYIGTRGRSQGGGPELRAAIESYLARGRVELTAAIFYGDTPDGLITGTVHWKGLLTGGTFSVN